MKKIFLWIVWGMFLCQGCDRFLDIQPKGYTIPSKYDDYRQLMNYAQMAKALDHNPVRICTDSLMSSFTPFIAKSLQRSPSNKK